MFSSQDAGRDVPLAFAISFRARYCNLLKENDRKRLGVASEEKARATKASNEQLRDIILSLDAH